MKLSIIIVNWFSRDFLADCLKSIRSQSGKFPFEVIVIDNASFDGSAELIKLEFPWVTFIQSEKNIGFSRANNQAFRRSSGKIVLFLNPDTALGEDALASLVDHMERNPDAGILGCRLLNTDGTLQYYCVQHFPNIINQVFSSHRINEKNLRKYHESMAPELSPVDCVSGACLMVRRDVFEKVGGFSEDYFMYSEDVDLCRKIRDAGYKVLYAKDVTVVHHEGKSSLQKEKDVSNFSTLMMVDSRFRYFRKYNGLLYAGTFRFLMLLGSISRLLLLGLLLRLSESSRQVDIRERFRKWRSVMEWSAGLRKVGV